MRKTAPASIALALCLIAAHAAADEPTDAPPAVSAQPAQPPTAPASRADALFQEGKTLFETGRFAEACARFAESDALDPTVSALGLLAGCHEQQDKLVKAWKEYREAERRATAAGDNRAAFARDRAAALSARLPRLTITLAKPAPDIEILRNADRVPPEEIGVDVPLDVGAWEIVARAPGRRDFHTTITIKEGSREAVLVPELSPIAPREVPPIEPPASTTDPRLTAALVAGGLGITGLGVGIALGVSASSQNTASNTLEKVCHQTGQGCVEGQVLRNNTFNTAAASTIGFGVGLAGLGVSAVLLLLPTRKPAPARRDSAGLHVTPLVGLRSGGVAFAGRF